MSTLSLVFTLLYMLWFIGGIYMLFVLQNLRKENTDIRAKLLEVEYKLDQITMGPRRPLTGPGTTTAEYQQPF